MLKSTQDLLDQFNCCLVVLEVYDNYSIKLQPIRMCNLLKCGLSQKVTHHQ